MNYKTRTPIFIVRKQSFFLILAILLISGCSTASKHELQSFNQNSTPVVSVLTAVPEEIFIEFIGHTIFSNGRSIHPIDTDINNLIDTVAKQLLRDSDDVKLFDPDEKTTANLRMRLPMEIDSYWHSPLPDAECRALAEWGNDNNVDYLLVIFPNKSSNVMTDTVGEPTGRGVLVTRDLTFLYSAYQLQLIDLTTGYVEYISNVATFKQVPSYRHTLTENDKHRIIKQWEEEKARTYKPGHDYETPEMVIDRSSRYTAEDFDKLPNEVLVHISEQLNPVVKEGIRQNLIDSGVIPGPAGNRFYIMPPDEGVTRPITKYW